MPIANIKIEQFAIAIVLTFAITDVLSKPSFPRMINSETLSNMADVIMKSTD